MLKIIKATGQTFRWILEFSDGTSCTYYPRDETVIPFRPEYLAAIAAWEGKA